MAETRIASFAVDEQDETVTAPLSYGRPARSATIGALAAALCKAQGAMQGAKRDNANPFFKSKYADLASHWDAARACLKANGLCVIQTTEGMDPVILVTTLAHESGEWIESRLPVVPVKDDPQGIGSAITYARRYAFSAIVGTSPEDDDAEAAMGRKTDHPEPAEIPGVDADVYAAAKAKWKGLKPGLGTAYLRKLSASMKGEKAMILDAIENGSEPA